MSAGGWGVSVWGWGSVTHTQFLFLVCSSEENDLNPKVLQLIRGENIKVKEGQNSWNYLHRVLELAAHTGTEEEQWSHHFLAFNFETGLKIYLIRSYLGFLLMKA